MIEQSAFLWGLSIRYREFDGSPMQREDCPTEINAIIYSLK